METAVFSFGHPRNLFSFVFKEVCTLTRHSIATTMSETLLGNKKWLFLSKQKQKQTKTPPPPDLMKS